MRAAASKALVVSARHAIAAVSAVATLAARAVTALFGRAAQRRRRATAIGTALVDGAGVGIIAIFGPLTGCFRLATAASGGVPGTTARSQTTAATTAVRRKFRAATCVSGKGAQREQYAHAQPVTETARLQDEAPGEGNPKV